MKKFQLIFCNRQVWTVIYKRKRHQYYRIVCHRSSHQQHTWTPSAGVWRLTCLPCHTRTYNCHNWPTVVSRPCSKSLLRPL